MPPPLRILRRLLRLAISVYIVLCIALTFGQRWLIFPGASSQGKPETAINFGNSAEIVHFQASRRSTNTITAVFGSALLANGSPDPDAAHRPTILYFYGNAAAAAWSETEFDHFRENGANVLIPDLLGYGQSGGRASEVGCYATADAAWAYLQKRPGVDAKKIIVVGWSLGSAIAIDLASRKPVAALATFNAFTTLPAMARKLYPWLPTSLLLDSRFDNLTKIAHVSCPMVICNGAMDTLIPPVMSDQLAAKAGGPVTRLVIKSADHNSIFTAEPDVVWPAVRNLIEQVAAKNAAHRVNR